MQDKPQHRGVISTTLSVDTLNMSIIANEVQYQQIERPIASPNY